MATALAIAELRSLIDENDQTSYTDFVLSDRLDAVDGDQYRLAEVIWREKAARYSGLVDIQEGTSSRKMSQLYTQALKMADSFASGLTAVVVSTRRPARTRPIERQ